MGNSSAVESAIPPLQGPVRRQVVAENVPIDPEAAVEALGAKTTPQWWVSGQGSMTPSGYRPENDAWFNSLTESVDGVPQGRDPMTISLAVLVQSGHGPRETRRIVSAMGDVALAEGLRGYRDLRRQCFECVENAAEVRRCDVIDCPIWPYRMGRNPHNPRRGKLPFGKGRAC